MKKNDPIARIDADVAKLQEIGAYVAKYPGFDSNAMGKQIDADIARLGEMRDYIAGAVAGGAPEPKPRKPRRKRAGLPETNEGL